MKYIYKKLFLICCICRCSVVHYRSDDFIDELCLFGYIVNMR